jgi:hypothetical protein
VEVVGLANAVGVEARVDLASAVRSLEALIRCAGGSRQENGRCFCSESAEEMSCSGTCE